jgi:cell division protein ZapA (FtsZ GTPase activity inhibitor)
MDKNPLTKFKVQVTLAWVVIQAVLLLLVQFGKLDAQMAEMIKQSMVYLTIIVGVVLTGHTVTDITAMVSAAKDDAAGKIDTVNMVKEFLKTNIGTIKSVDDVEKAMKTIADKITEKPKV